MIAAENQPKADIRSLRSEGGPLDYSGSSTIGIVRTDKL